MQFTEQSHTAVPLDIYLKSIVSPMTLLGSPCRSYILPYMEPCVGQFSCEVNVFGGKLVISKFATVYPFT